MAARQHGQGMFMFIHIHLCFLFLFLGLFHGFCFCGKDPDCVRTDSYFLYDEVDMYCTRECDKLS